MGIEYEQSESSQLHSSTGYQIRDGYMTAMQAGQSNRVGEVTEEIDTPSDEIKLKAERIYTENIFHIRPGDVYWLIGDIAGRYNPAKKQRVQSKPWERWDYYRIG